MASKNIFSYLDSDDEDTSKKVQAPPAPVETKPKTVKPRKEGDNKKPEGAKGGRGYARDGAKGGRGERKPRADGERKPRGPRPEGSTGTNLRNERERGERPDRSHAHQGERGDRPKRNYDRRSGTGRGKEVSKSGGGGHNWGNEADKTELAAEAEIQEGAVVTEETTEEVAEVVVAEEDKTLSYEEYLAQKKQSRAASEHFAEVQVRSVTNEFAEAALVTKDGKTPDFIEASYEKVFTKKTSGRKKQLITDVGFSVTPTSNPREEREGGRGGRGRGGRDGGRGRGNNSAPKRADKSKAPNVTDVNAFPSL
ncbi:hypothetical protein THRCLA_07005 [Thraustotheca clavata]|uniref:Hyaluronan/mRNA-binding protein domain-containing protein n=1 Tax=Thraustotheca clavata TaxID=74557 RepID=A0A1V9ZH99_9STRA|nr:hypothetical protein THRCLA_07005 [Thraustotheca clavata]